MTEILIVKAKIKEVVKDCNVGSDVAEALSKIIEEAIKTGAKRADANDRKTIQGKDIHIGKGMAKEMLIVKSKIKDVAGKHNVGGDVADALNETAIWHLMQGCERAKENNRKTVQARDI